MRWNACLPPPPAGEPPAPPGTCSSTPSGTAVTSSAPHRRRTRLPLSPTASDRQSSVRFLCLKHNARFKQEPGLRCIPAVSAEGQSGCSAVSPDMGELGAREEDLVPIGRGHGYRPCIAARTVKQIGGAIGDAAGARNILEPSRKTEARQPR